MGAAGIKSRQTVKPNGERLLDPIEGVLLRQQVTQQDDRGTLTEIYSPFWGFDDIPLTYLYTVTARPGKVKGWAINASLWQTLVTDRYPSAFVTT